MVAICTIAGSFLITSSSGTSAQKPQSSDMGAKKSVSIRGRVLAWKETLAFGAGLGPQWTVFIFGAEAGGTQVQPLKIAYAFFNSEGPPPDSFFDYSKRYELQAVRDTKCDESVKSLSYIENVDESGKALPPSYALRLLEGAPKDLLKPDAILPCYTLRPGKYKVLGQGTERKSGTVSPNGNVEPTTTTQ